jgi:hypothetical protein
METTPNLLQQAKGQAAKAVSKQVCVEGEDVYFLEDTKARKPGHIYSRAGLREYGTSGCCEYHFDLFFGEPEEE